MKKALSLLLIGLVFRIIPDLAHAFKCGRLVSVGDPSFKVLNNCGEPIAKELIGYTLSKDRKRELKMEHWVYGPEGGYYYPN